MKLIEEIVDLLSSGESNLATALLKTKVLLHKLGEVELLDWVNGELQGYTNIEDMPNYRVLHLTVQGNGSNGAYRFTGQTLPLMHLEDKEKSKIIDTHFSNFQKY